MRDRRRRGVDTWKKKRKEKKRKRRNRRETREKKWMEIEFAVGGKGKVITENANPRGGERFDEMNMAYAPLPPKSPS